jgi:hypothetical protein
MEHIKKLYAKPYHLYTIEDWKYIFSIYKEKDKYNHTEEEFLAAELIDKTAMMKKMDESIYDKGTIHIDSLHKDESVFAPCPEDEGCKVIQDFLEDEDVLDCNPENSCDVIQDFLEETTALHHSIWYFEFKDEKEKRILDIEKRLFEIKDEQIELKKELNIIQNDLLTRLNESLK